MSEKTIISEPKPCNFYTVNQVSEFLCLTRQTVTSLIKTGELKAIRFGSGKRKNIRIPVEEFDEFIRKSKEGQ